MFKVYTNRGAVEVQTRAEADAISTALYNLGFDYSVTISELKHLNGVCISPSLCVLLDKAPNRVSAIKYVRELTSCGLKEAKDFVDSCQS